MKRVQILSIVMAGLTLLVAGCTREGVKITTEDSAKAGAAQKLYTAYNLWYEKPQRMYAINYRRGTMIPAGTEVTAVRVRESARRPKISFATLPTQSEYTIYFRPKFFPGVTLQDLKDRLFTAKPLEERTAGLKPSEIKAIQRGSLVEGMCREAVLMTRGYPPSHETHSLDSNTWLYWENRFVKEAVRFDANGRTIRE
ncbi:MAG: hypothetical protein JSU63_14855 [Phycisphaerales bacterium]|nr:MAG: hypothetical protein JSU63_14855 [Phycisphaerales bacterium]